MKNPSAKLEKVWTKSTFAADIAVSALVCLFLLISFESPRHAGPITEIFMLANFAVREAGRISGFVYLFIFASNAVLVGHFIYHRCNKARELEEKCKVRTAVLGIGIKAWTVLIILINIAAIVFPLLFLIIGREEGSHAQMAGEVYPPAVQAAGLTTIQVLHFVVFFWVILFASNISLLIRKLFHKCDNRRTSLPVGAI